MRNIDDTDDEEEEDNSLKISILAHIKYILFHLPWVFHLHRYAAACSCC